MIVFLNGHWVPEERATISVFDRSFLYGDGLFETLRVANGRPFRWIQHWERFEEGAAFLGIQVPFKKASLRDRVSELVTRNRMPDSILRITLSRGPGARGYSPADANSSTLVMSLHPVPPVPARCRVRTVGLCLPSGGPLARFKTNNKLVQVIARAQAEAAGADEALLLNSEGFVVEGSSGNLFWIKRGVVCTPPLEGGVLPGVTRAVTIELCHRLGVDFQESAVRPGDLAGVEAAFLTQSSLGIVNLTEIDDVPMQGSPIVDHLTDGYAAWVLEECG
jgi:aminodeoxychorismate lyase